MSESSEKEIELYLSHAQIGTMYLIGGKLTIAPNKKEINLEFNHELETFEIKIVIASLKACQNMLATDNCISLKFGPKMIRHIGQVISKYGFVFQMLPRDHAVLDFILYFKNLSSQHLTILEDLLPEKNTENYDSQTFEEDPENIPIMLQKKKPCDPNDNSDLIHSEKFDLTPTTERRKRKQSEEEDVETILQPIKRPSFSFKIQSNENTPPKVIYRQRKNSRDQNKIELSLITPEKINDEKNKNCEDNSPKPFLDRRTRNRTRANYAENNFTLDEVTEEQQIENAIRLSMKTYEKENPNGVLYDNVKKIDEDFIPLDVDKDQELFTYHTISRGDLSVKIEDYLCLARNEYLNDVDIDFYIQYIYNAKMTEDQRKRIYIFGSHFYSLYSASTEFSGWKSDENAGLNASQKRYLRVDGIIKDVNLFEKDFLIIPLMDRNHWFLAIVCYPGLEGYWTQDGHRLPDEMCKNLKDIDPLPSLKSSMILIFDSIVGNQGRKMSAMMHIRNFLKSEYLAKYKDSDNVKLGELTGHAPTCPLQLNNVDCGCFLLEFIERFFVTSPITNLCVPLILQQWFDPANVGATKRREIANVFEMLMGDSQLSLPQIKFEPDSPQPSTKSIVDEDSSNNNNNNEAGNEEFNNNNFNCMDSNNAQDDQKDATAATHQSSGLSTTSIEDDDMRLIKDNIEELIKKFPEVSNQEKFLNDINHSTADLKISESSNELKESLLKSLSSNTRCLKEAITNTIDSDVIDTDLATNSDPETKNNLENSKNCDIEVKIDSQSNEVKISDSQTKSELPHETKVVDSISNSNSITILIDDDDENKIDDSNDEKTQSDNYTDALSVQASESPIILSD